MKWYVIKKNNHLSITTDYILAKKETCKNDKTIFRTFEHFQSAIDYIQNDCEDLPLEFQISINENDYTKTLFVDLLDINKIKFYNEKFEVFKEEIKEIITEEYELDENKNVIIKDSLNENYNSMLMFLLAIELTEKINFNRIIFNKFPKFEKDKELGFIYNELIDYCIKIKKEISSKIILKESDIFDDISIFL